MSEETYSSEALICPYCQHHHFDDLESLEEFPYPFECEECGQRFNASKEVSVDYVGEPIE